MHVQKTMAYVPSPHFGFSRVPVFCACLRRILRLQRTQYMHRNPVVRGLVLEPEQWQWSSYRSYAYQEQGRVKINQAQGGDEGSGCSVARV
jgi:hypothetical protein